MRAIDVLWVWVGGGFGSLLRWQIAHFIDARVSFRFKFSTLFINVSGAFVIAYLSARLAIDWQHRYGDMMSSLVLTGVLGGYTTFSTMQLDAVRMSRSGHRALAVGYLAASLAAGLLAAAAGVALARS